MCNSLEADDSVINNLSCKLDMLKMNYTIMCATFL